MQPAQLVQYYISHIDEFTGDDGHKVLVDLLKRKLPRFYTDKNLLAIDVGCCTGEYLKYLKDLAPEKTCKYWAFEPNPYNLAELRPKVANDSRVKLFECGLSDVNTTAPFYALDQTINKTSGCSALRNFGAKIADVEVRRLGDLLEQEYGENVVIKYMKIDTEGNDILVLKGMGDYITKVECAIFEMSNCSNLTDPRGPGIPDPMEHIVSYLSEKGFDTYRVGTKKMFKVNDEYWDKLYDEKKTWSDCFMIKKDNDLINELVDKDFSYIF